jgi:N-acetyltransferase 10
LRYIYGLSQSKEPAVVLTPSFVAPQREVGVPVNQCLALFVKLIRKIVKHLRDLRKKVIAASVPDASEAPAMDRPLEQDLDEELKEAGDEVTKQLKEVQRKMIDGLDLSE